GVRALRVCGAGALRARGGGGAQGGHRESVGELARGVDADALAGEDHQGAGAVRDELSARVVDAGSGVAEAFAHAALLAGGDELAAEDGREIVELEVDAGEAVVGVFEGEEDSPEGGGVDEGREDAAVHDAVRLEVFGADVERDAGAAELDVFEAHGEEGGEGGGADGVL